MLSTAKSANVEFSQVVQLLAPPTNPANGRVARSTVGKKTDILPNFKSN